MGFTLMVTLKYVSKIFIMTYWLTYDKVWDCKIEKLFDTIKPQIVEFLKDKVYGEEVDELRNIIICNDAMNYGFKKRRKFSRKDRYIYFDVYVDYDFFMMKTEEQKKIMIAESFIRDMDLLSKFKPENFELANLKEDFEFFFRSIGWF